MLSRGENMQIFLTLNPASETYVDLRSRIISDFHSFDCAMYLSDSDVIETFPYNTKV